MKTNSSHRLAMLSTQSIAQLVMTNPPSASTASKIAKKATQNVEVAAIKTALQVQGKVITKWTQE